TALFVPEAAVKSTPRLLPVLGGGPGRLVSLFLAQPTLEQAEGVVPQRVDLDRLAAPRGHHPIAALRIHPRQLIPFLPLAEQPVGRVNADPKVCAAQVPGDNVL